MCRNFFRIISIKIEICRAEESRTYGIPKKKCQGLMVSAISEKFVYSVKFVCFREIQLRRCETMRCGEESLDSAYIAE